MVVYWLNDIVILFIVVVYYRSGIGDLEYKLYVVILDDLCYDK